MVGMKAGDAMPCDPDVKADTSFHSYCTKVPGMDKPIKTGRAVAAGGPVESEWEVPVKELGFLVV